VIPVLNWHREAVTRREKVGIQYVFNVRPVLFSGKLFFASLVLRVRALTNPKNQHQHNQQTNQTLTTRRTTTTTPPLKHSCYPIPYKKPGNDDKNLPDLDSASIVLTAAYSRTSATFQVISILPSKSTPSLLPSHSDLTPASNLQTFHPSFSTPPHPPHLQRNPPFHSSQPLFRNKSPHLPHSIQSNSQVTSILPSTSSPDLNSLKRKSQFKTPTLNS
jgi:hypothetical protein